MQLVLNVLMDIILIGISYYQILRHHYQLIPIIINISILFVVNATQDAPYVHHNILVLNVCLDTIGINQHLQ